MKIKLKKQKAEYNTEVILNALEIYLQEYIHRDNHMWAQKYRLFFSTLVVILLPNLATGIGMDLPELLSSHSYIFPVLGLGLAFIFLYISLALAKRFNSVSKTYNKLILMLPKELQRIKLEDLPIKLLNHPNAYLITAFMFIALVIVACLSLISC